jgi:hypothetical protein
MRVVSNFAGRLQTENAQLWTPAVRASETVEITAGKEPAKRLFFRGTCFSRERKQQSLKEETWQ